LSNRLIIIRGAGELGSAIAVTLYRTGFRVMLVELPGPLAIRRTVTFSDVMFTGSTSVEGIRAMKADPIDQLQDISSDIIPIVNNSILDLSQMNRMPGWIIDARMQKDLNTIDEFTVIPTIGLGPGFTVGQNCLIAIETKRGHDLGRIIREGSTSQNTGVPGEIGGESSHRVIYSTTEGIAEWDVEIGAIVNEKQTIGNINNRPIISKIAGKVRGLISPRVNTPAGVKIADIDPRGHEINHLLISDKANAIARAVLEVVVTMERND